MLSKVRARLKQEAQEVMTRWPIDWTKYHPPVVAVCPYNCKHSVAWRAKNPKKHLNIRLTNVWIDDTGKILQYGSNYMELQA